MSPQLTDRRHELRTLVDAAAEADWQGQYDAADRLRERAKALKDVIEIDGPWQPDF